MINPKINFYQILSNYLLSKASDDFISNKFGRYDSSDLEIITGLVNSYKNSDTEMNNTIRYKIYLAYLLEIITKYLRTIDEDNLMNIVQTLHNSNADRVVPCYILNEIRNLVYKKISYLLSTNSISKYESEFEELVELNYANKDNEEQAYTNEIFYNDLCKFIKQHIYTKNTSVLLEMTKNLDLSQETDDELDLCKNFMLINATIDLNQSNLLHMSHKSFLKQKSTSILEKTNIDINDIPPIAKSSKVVPLTNSSPQKTPEKRQPTPTKSLASNKPKNSDKNKENETDHQVENDNYGGFLDFDNGHNNSELDFNESPNEKSKKSAKKTPDKNRRSAKLAAIENIAETADVSPVRKKTARNIGASRKTYNEQDEESSDQEIPRKISKKQNKVLDTSDDEHERSPKKFDSKKSADMPTTSKKAAAADQSRKEKTNAKKIEENDSNMEDSIDENSTANNSRPSVKTDSRCFWTDTECVYLVAGVEIYGRGNWSKILSEFPDKFNKIRTGVHLKDKYRNLLRSSSMMKMYEKKAQLITRHYQEQKSI